MSIASAITAAQGRVADAYTAISAKGGTLPATQNLANMPTAIASIPSGAPDYYIEKALDQNGTLVSSNVLLNFNGIKNFGERALAYAYYGAVFPANTSINMGTLERITGSYACNYAFYNTRNIVSVDMSNVTSISGPTSCQYMFYGCPSLTTVDLGSLTEITNSSSCNHMFESCSALSSLDLSSLTTVNGMWNCAEMFQNCTSLTTVDLSSLVTAEGSQPLNNMFRSCTSLRTLNMNGLNVLKTQICSSTSQMLQGCTKLESVTMGGLTASTFTSSVNQIQYLFGNTTGRDAANGCTVHFPSNFDPSDPDHTFDASTLAGYPTFGGSASYIHVAFDLPASE